MNDEHRGRLYVIAGPSGVGKGTVVQTLLQRDPTLRLSVSATTREPREGDVDGITYRFMTMEGFQGLIEDDALLEWAEVFGNRYGTPARPIEEWRAEGEDVILEIDVQGARTVRDRLGDDAVLIFLRPPSLDELKRRLAERGTEDEEQVTRRLSAASEEIESATWFGHVVTNDDLETAVGAVAAIIQGHRSSR